MESRSIATDRGPSGASDRVPRWKWAILGVSAGTLTAVLGLAQNTTAGLAAALVGLGVVLLTLTAFLIYGAIRQPVR